MHPILKGIGAALHAILWTPIVMVVHGVSHGVADALRRVMPLVLGCVALWATMTYAPHLLHGVALLLIVAYAFRIMIRGVTGSSRKK